LLPPRSFRRFFFFFFSFFFFFFFFFFCFFGNGAKAATVAKRLPKAAVFGKAGGMTRLVQEGRRRLLVFQIPAQAKRIGTPVAEARFRRTSRAFAIGTHKDGNHAHVRRLQRTGGY